MSLLDDEDILVENSDKTVEEFVLERTAEENFQRFMERYPYKMQDLYVHVAKSKYKDLTVSKACEVIGKLIENSEICPCHSEFSYQNFLDFLKAHPVNVIVFKEFSALRASARKAITEFIKQNSCVVSQVGGSTFFSGEDIPGLWDRGFAGNIPHSNSGSYQFIFVDGPREHHRLYSVFYPVAYGSFFPKDSEVKQLIQK